MPTRIGGRLLAALCTLGLCAAPGLAQFSAATAGPMQAIPTTAPADDDVELAGLGKRPTVLRAPPRLHRATLGAPIMHGEAGLATTGSAKLTLEEARQRVMNNSKAIQLAAQNIRSKQFATKVAKSNYFPRVIGGLVYFHFNDELGEVVTLGGRTLPGSLGLTVPTRTFAAPFLNQDTEFSTISMVQPITALLKVRHGVKIAQADERIAQAELEKGARALLGGVEQLYFGLLAAQRIQAGTQIAEQGIAELVKLQPSVALRTALLETRQGLSAITYQIADLEEQLDILLDLPTCTKLELIEPALPSPPVRCAEEAVSRALTSSPEVREAEQDIIKANAAAAAAKVDYLPNVTAFGGYLNQTAQSYMQQNIGYVGVGVTYTFVDWGSRRNTVRERNTYIAMASLKLRQTQDEVRQKALKAFRELAQAGETLKMAQEMVALRQEAEKEAQAPPARFQAAKDHMQAEIDLVKADLAYRTAYVQLASLFGRP
jgi:outer membrane protein TolC